MKIRNELHRKAVCILCLVSFLFAGVDAVMGQEYHSDDKAALQAFLTQPSQDAGKANWEQILSYEQEPDWDNSEDWAKGDGVIWNKDSPKRITLINWENKRIAGSLDVSACEGLTSLFCYDNALTSLTAIGLSRLTTIECFNNNLERLDLSALSSLKRLVCHDNKLKTLDVSGLASLTNLQCYNNLLEAIDLSSPVELYLLDVHNNQLTSLDVRTLEKLQRLICSHNRLEELELSSSAKLDKVDCSTNRLKELNTTGWEYLTELVCSSNNLTSLDLSDSRYLTALNCSANRLESLNIIRQYELLLLDCSNNKLAAIDLSENQKLEELYIYKNDLPEIKLDGLKKIRKMHCYENRIPLSKLPDAQGLTFYEYLYAPQQDIDGGTTTHGIIDLQNQLRKDKTEFRWYTDDDPKTELTNITNENGIFSIPATYIGKTLVCRISNPDLPGTMLYPLIYSIYVEGSTVGTATIKGSNATICQQAGTLYIQLTQQDELHIYTPTGTLYLRKKLSEGTHQFTLPKGIWLVALKEETFKVAM